MRRVRTVRPGETTEMRDGEQRRTSDGHRPFHVLRYGRKSRIQYGDIPKRRKAEEPSSDRARPKHHRDAGKQCQDSQRLMNDRNLSHRYQGGKDDRDDRQRDAMNDAKGRKSGTQCICHTHAADRGTFGFRHDVNLQME